MTKKSKSCFGASSIAAVFNSIHRFLFYDFNFMHNGFWHTRKKNEGKKRKLKSWLNYLTSCTDLWLVDRGAGRGMWRQLYKNWALNRCDGCQIKIIRFRWCVMCVFCVGLIFGVAFIPISMLKLILVDLAPRKYWKIPLCRRSLIDTTKMSKTYFYLLN